MEAGPYPFHRILLIRRFFSSPVSSSTVVDTIEAGLALKLCVSCIKRKFVGREIGIGLLVGQWNCLATEERWGEKSEVASHCWVRARLGGRVGG